MSQTFSEMGTQESHCCGWPLTVDPLPLCYLGVPCPAQSLSSSLLFPVAPTVSAEEDLSFRRDVPTTCTSCDTVSYTTLTVWEVKWPQKISSCLPQIPLPHLCFPASPQPTLFPQHGLKGPALAITSVPLESTASFFFQRTRVRVANFCLILRQ